MGFIKKQDDNMTIWQFDDTIQKSINQMIMIEIVKLPNCHDKNYCRIVSDLMDIVLHRARLGCRTDNDQPTTKEEPRNN